MFDQITSEHLQHALKEIDQNGIRVGRQSSTYDLVAEGKRYPPKYVLSLANKYATGEELDPNMFEGGEGTPAFIFLRNKGYSVIPKKQFTWIPFYQELCKKLYELSVEELINLVKEVLKIQNLTGLQDKDAQRNTIPLKDVDPYTVLSFIGIGKDETRFRVLVRLRELLSITTLVPTDLAGLYTARNQWIWMFGYSYERRKGDINILRALYKQMEQEGTVSENLFNQALSIRKLKADKLTEALFSHRPDMYFPINKQTVLWLRKRGLPFRFEDLSEYEHLLATVRQNHPRPFYVISNEAYQEALSTTAQQSGEINYWIFQGNPSQFRIVDSLRDNSLLTWRVAAHEQRIRPGDKVILWVSGDEAGCYALAEVASEVYTGTDETLEQYYKAPGAGNESTQRVKITVLLNLWDRPVLKDELQSLAAFNGFKGGNQGTNFTATREQYRAIEELARPPIPAGVRRFWKYSAGKQAVHWPDDLQNQSMSIDYSNYDTGPLDQFNTQTDLDNHLGKPPRVSNDTWNMILFKDAVVGDVIIANRGRNMVVGIGIITGSYQYRNENGPYNRHYRAVNWLADQLWQYTPNQFPGNKNLFRVDTFSPTRVGPQIIHEYVNQYPQYRPVFEENGLLEPNQLTVQPMPEQDNRYAKNIILYGPPGTGKTYETIDLAVDIIVEGGKDPNHKINKHRFDELRQEGLIEFVTFHQNYTYEDFVLGLKPDVNGETDGLRFERREGVFYRISKRAMENFTGTQQGGQIRHMPFEEVVEALLKQLANGQEMSFETKTGVPFKLTGVSDNERSVIMKLSTGATYNIPLNRLKQSYEGSSPTDNNQRTYYEPIADFLHTKGTIKVATPVKSQNYVLIIDEINRANMSRVFGELITLLEDDKRYGGENALTVTLSSGESFSVPPNLYLIGTMNTADKSLALLDVALRRRFEFIGKYPNYDVVDGLARGVLERLNKAILAHHKPADFLIGHAYFIGKQPEQLPGVFNNRVIPLLMEYFNGRTDLVKTLLTDAGISSERHPLTDQLTVDHVG